VEPEKRQTTVESRDRQATVELQDRRGRGKIIGSEHQGGAEGSDLFPIPQLPRPWWLRRVRRAGG